MKSLLIDTSNDTFLGLSDDGNLFYEFTSPSLKTSSSLAEQIKIFLEHSKQSLPSIDYISIGVGPGSFLGTRIGVTLAKTLAYGLEIPLVSFCSLQIYSPPELSKFCVATDAKSQGVYILRGTKTNEKLSYEEKATLCSLEEFAVLYQQEGFLPITPNETLREKLLSLNIPSIKSNTSLADLCEYCHTMMNQSRHESADSLAVQYLRLL